MESDLLEPSLYIVKAILIFDNDGNRLIAKYYDNTFATAKEQKTFEKSLFVKTYKANGEIIMIEGLTCVYRSSVDLFFYVVGGPQENELLLLSVLTCLYDSVSHILRKNVEKRAILDNMDGVFLAVDEICDSGIILESDPIIVMQRMAISTDIPLGEQTVSSVLQTATEQIKRSLLKWRLTIHHQLLFILILY